MDTVSYFSVVTAQFNNAGQLICSVIPSQPLNIKEFIIVKYITATPIGKVSPGNPDPAVRTLFVDPQDDIFTTLAPFTLALTYDDQSYKLTAPLVVLAGVPAQSAVNLFDFTGVADLSPEDAAIFMTRAVAVAGPQLNSSSRDLGPLAMQYLLTCGQNGRNPRPDAE